MGASPRQAASRVSVLVRARDRKPWGVFDWHGKLQDRFRTERGARLCVLRCDREAGRSVLWMKWIGEADPYVPEDKASISVKCEP